MDGKNVEEKRRCLVIGPIGAADSLTRRRADILLNAVIKEALEKNGLGYETFRDDEISVPEMITNHLIGDLTNCDLVIADLADLNTNVFYELGIRHCARKPVIYDNRSNF